MNLFQRATTALTGLSLFASLSAPAHATPTNDHAAHVSLANAVMSTGVELYVNPEICNETPAFGWYSGERKILVICQENHKSTTAEGQVEWTAEDYDTLRHEAHHLIQDCMDRRIDHQLTPVYRDPIAFAIETIGPKNMRKIHVQYTSQGKDLNTVILEYEAFSVATLNDPLEQVADIKRYCLGGGN